MLPCIHPEKYCNGTHVYLPDGSHYAMRTTESFNNAICLGFRSKSVIEGIKGVSPLHNHVHLVAGVPPDYMHCVTRRCHEVFVEVLDKFLIQR
jgi:hypothetical protein